MVTPFILRPRVGRRGDADTGHQVLLPQEPLPVALAAQLDGPGVIGTAAGDEELAVALLHIGGVVAAHQQGEGLAGGVAVFRRCPHKVGEGDVALAVPEAVVQEGDVLPVQRPGAPQPVEHLLPNGLVGTVGAQSADGEGCGLEGGVQTGLRQCLHKPQTHPRIILGAVCGLCEHLLC